MLAALLAPLLLGVTGASDTVSWISVPIGVDPAVRWNRWCNNWAPRAIRSGW